MDFYSKVFGRGSPEALLQAERMNFSLTFIINLLFITIGSSGFMYTNEGKTLCVASIEKSKSTFGGSTAFCGD